VIVLFASFLGFFTASASIGLVTMAVSVAALVAVFAVSARLVWSASTSRTVAAQGHASLNARPLRS
jgi:hypothetical protein